MWLGSRCRGCPVESITNTLPSQVMAWLGWNRKQLRDADSNHILAQAVMRRAQRGNLELVSGLVGTSSTMEK